MEETHVSEAKVEHRLLQHKSPHSLRLKRLRLHVRVPEFLSRGLVRHGFAAGGRRLFYQPHERHHDGAEDGQHRDDVEVGQHLRLVVQHVVDVALRGGDGVGVVAAARPAAALQVPCNG